MSDLIEDLDGPVPSMCENGKATIDFGLNYRQRKAAAALLRECGEALGDARNNILSLLGGFRDDMPDAAVKLFQAQARQIDATLAKLSERAN